jgi:putative hydrolase of the HAD superfamily
MTAADFTAGKTTVLFDLFHTLTSLESAASGGPLTSELLGVGRDEWNAQLLEKSRDRLTGAEKDPYIIIEKMAHAINPDIPMSVINEATRNRIKRFERTLINIPAATLCTLRTLKIMDKKIGLISNADVSEVYGWQKSPLKDCFDSVVFSCQVGLVKPEKEIYEYALKELNERPENTVFIGDGGSRELWGAKQAGLATIMITGVINELWPDQIEPRRLYADYVIEHIEELIQSKE